MREKLLAQIRTRLETKLSLTSIIDRFMEQLDKYSVEEMRIVKEVIFHYETKIWGLDDVILKLQKEEKKLEQLEPVQ